MYSISLISEINFVRVLWGVWKIVKSAQKKDAINKIIRPYLQKHFLKARQTFSPPFITAIEKPIPSSFFARYLV